MKNTLRLNTIIGLAAIVAICGFAIFKSTASQATGNPHRVIVNLEDEAVNESARSALENLGGKVVKNLPLVNGMVVILPEEALVKKVKMLKGVRSVEKDARVFALKPPGGCEPWPACKDSDDGDSSQPAEVVEWGVDRIDADLAWAVAAGLGVNVAVVDTGIDSDHPDLVDNIKGGINFTSKNPRKPADPNKWDDDNGHGTHVAGIVGAVDNEIGVIGVAPQASLWAVKVLDRNGSGYVSDIIDAISWSMDNGMDVINMSLGTESDVQSLHDAVDAANASGIAVVASAGNYGDGNGATNEILYPAKYGSVIAVAATASDDSTPTWSSEGAEISVAAPGVSIRSTWNDGQYNTIQGTSMACPHVAGAVALLLESGVSAGDIQTVLQATADDLGEIGFDNFYGYGLVDVEESVTGMQTNP